MSRYRPLAYLSAVSTLKARPGIRIIAAKSMRGRARVARRKVRTSGNGRVAIETCAFRRAMALF